MFRAFFVTRRQTRIQPHHGNLSKEKRDARTQTPFWVPACFTCTCLALCLVSLSSPLGPLLECRKTSFGSPRLPSFQVANRQCWMDVSNASLTLQEWHADPVMQALTHSDGLTCRFCAGGIAAGVAGEAGSAMSASRTIAAGSPDRHRWAGTVMRDGRMNN